MFLASKSVEFLYFFICVTSSISTMTKTTAKIPIIQDANEDHCNLVRRIFLAESVAWKFCRVLSRDVEVSVLRKTDLFRALCAVVAEQAAMEGFTTVAILRRRSILFNAIVSSSIPEDCAFETFTLLDTNAIGGINRRAFSPATDSLKNFVLSEDRATRGGCKMVEEVTDSCIVLIRRHFAHPATNCFKRQ